MKNSPITKLLYLRALLTRFLLPKSSYRLAPLSSKFGFDRGAPIDRFWIESFLDANRRFITGRVLEITDDVYTKRFGINVTRSDVLDINPKNKKANILGDLRHLTAVKANTYDCVILTHVLGLIDDVHAVSSEVRRILKPQGALLLTSSCLGPVLGEKVFWRFTPNSINYLFKQHFITTTTTYGNALTGQCFWVGMAQEELTNKQLKFNDPRYPCIVAMRAIKKNS